MTRALAVLLALFTGAACALPPTHASAASPARATAARDLVYLPRGACETETIELELYDRAAASWRPHPEHPRLTTGTCVSLDTSSLLNELRLRCIDPAGRAPPSPWVTGFEVATGGLPCADD
jgi:hypothetical protein